MVQDFILLTATRTMCCSPTRTLVHRLIHQKAHQGRHPQYEGDEYSGEETVREGDGLEMTVERWRRRMEKMV